MRIIAGKHRGRKLLTPRDDTVIRPTGTDRIIVSGRKLPVMAYAVPSTVRTPKMMKMSRSPSA